MLCYHAVLSLHCSSLCRKVGFIIGLLIVVPQGMLHHYTTLYCATRRASSSHCSLLCRQVGFITGLLIVVLLNGFIITLIFVVLLGGLYHWIAHCCATRRASSLHYSLLCCKMGFIIRLLIIVPLGGLHQFLIHLLID